MIPLVLHIEPLAKGFITGGGLIMAIGAQNAFLISQSIRRQYHFFIATACILLDIVLIFSGMFVISQALNNNPQWIVIMKWTGVIFLTAYGIFSLHSAFKKKIIDLEKSFIDSRKKAFLMTLALTLLNPHAYLDTMVLMSGVGAQYEPEGHFYFSVGACVAGGIWFYTICFAGGYLQPYFKNSFIWQVLDFITGLIMLGIALTLVF